MRLSMESSDSAKIKYALGNHIFIFDSNLKYETYECEFYHGIIFIIENEGDGVLSKDARYDVVYHPNINWERLIINNRSGVKDVPFHEGTFHLLPEGIKVIKL